jgi:hypothetical protein
MDKTQLMTMTLRCIHPSPETALVVGVRHKEVAPTDCRCNKITRRLPNRVAFGVTLAYTILFLYHDYDQLATEPTTLSATLSNCLPLV